MPEIVGPPAGSVPPPPDSVGSPEIINVSVELEDLKDPITKGSLIVGDGVGSPSGLAVGTPAQVLTADPAEATGLKWVSGVAPTGSAGGDLSGTYPNPTVDDDSHDHTLSTITDAGTAAASAATDFLAVAGDQMLGDIDMDGNEITGATELSTLVSTFEYGFFGDLIRGKRLILGRPSVLDPAASEIDFNAATLGAPVLTSKVQGQAGDRLSLNTNGIWFGGGVTSPDWRMDRLSANTMQLAAGDTIRIPQDPVVANDLTRKSYVDSVSAIFGQNETHDESLGESTDTTEIFAQKLRITTPSLIADDYYIEVVSDVKTSSGATTIEMRVQIDDTTDVRLDDISPATTGQLEPYNRPCYRALSAGVHTIDLDFRRSSGGGTATIKNVQIMMWRLAT